MVDIRSQADLAQQQAALLDKLDDVERDRLFQLALNEEHEANTLMAHYRDRIYAFDREREEWLSKLQTVRASMGQVHKSQWDLQTHKEEIAELQRSISEAKLSLYDERQQMLKLMKENDQLKIKEIEDKKKIKELISINEPVEQEVILYKDLRPESTGRQSRDGGPSGQKSKESFDKLAKNITSRTMTSGHGRPVSLSTAGSTGTTRSVLKTIYMPNEAIDSVAIENDNLKRQLMQDQLVCQDHIQALKEEIVIREGEWKTRFELDQQLIRELQDRHARLEKINTDLSKEYFGLRLKANQNEKLLKEEHELLVLRHDALETKLKKKDRSHTIENQTLKELAEKKAEEYANKFRRQIKNKDEDLLIVKDQYAQVQKIYMDKIKALEDNLSKLADKYNNLDQRRLLEIEGFKEDVRNLKKRVDRFIAGGHLGADAEDLDESDTVSASIDDEELDLIRKQLGELERKVDGKRSRR